jgi:hypothetical protein
LAQRLVLPLITLPPVILVPGHKSIQLAKWPTVGKRDMSAPVSAAKAVLEGTNRLGRSVSVAIEGEDLAKHLLHRARKGSLAAPKLKVTGFARQT